MADTEQISKLPICPLCKEVELTNEEVAMYKDGKGACWFCIAETFIKMDSSELIPDSVIYGRPGENKDTATARHTKKQANKHFAPIDANAVNNGTTPAPGHVAPQLSGRSISQLSLNDQERKDFALKYGTDPTPKIAPTEIIVHGAGEDTFLKFSIPMPIDVKEEQEVKRIMSGMLEIFGKLFKYGPQFASTLLELQAMNPEMFLGGKK